MEGDSKRKEPPGLEAGLEPGGHLIGVLGQVEVEPVGKKRFKLGAQQPALGQNSAPLLFHTEEVGLESGVHDEKGLAHEGAVLGAADVEGVSEAGQIGQSQVVGRGGEGAAQPCAVQKEEQSMGAAARREGLQLRAGIDAAGLRGVGEIDQTGLDQMDVVIEGEGRFDESGGELPVRTGWGGGEACGRWLPPRRPHARSHDRCGHRTHPPRGAGRRRWR